MSKGSIITGIVCGVVGLALGGGGVYLYFSKLSDARKEKEYQSYKDDLEEARAMIKKLQSERVVVGNAAKEELKSSNEYQESVESVIIDGDNESEEVNTDDDDDLNLDIEELPPDDIRFISPKDYEDDDDYEKETIKYYKDGTLTQDGEIVEYDEFMTLCGSEALDSFGKYGASSSEVYVRNEHFCTDYKIKKYKMSYEQYVNSVNK